MMTNADLAAALRRIAPETGSLACFGCGHEHNCGRLASGVETLFDYCPWCGARMDGDDDAKES